jgi:hypothetical protein
MSASGLLSDVSAKVLNSTEGAHIKNMSAFETDGHLQALTPSQYSTLEEGGSLGGGTLAQRSIMIVWEDRPSHFWLSH